MAHSRSISCQIHIPSDRGLHCIADADGRGSDIRTARQHGGRRQANERDSDVLRSERRIHSSSMSHALAQQIPDGQVCFRCDSALQKRIRRVAAQRAFRQDNRRGHRKISQ